MRLKTEKRRGAVAVLVALCLTAVMGIVAIALDGGMLLDNHRSVQSAADAAALAAADDLFSNYVSNQGLDPSGTAAASALSTAAANGYNNDRTTSTVTVNIPPQSGSFAGLPGYAEVIITYNQPRYFSGIFGSGNLPVTSRAVAHGSPGQIAILILNPTLQGALEIRGNVNVKSGGQIYSNSNNTTPNDAASQGANGSIYIGSGAQVQVGGINVFNSLAVDTASGSKVTYVDAQGQTNPNGSPTVYTTPMPDPLLNIPEVSTTGLTNYGNKTITSSTTIQPGVYNNLTVGSSTATPTVTLAPGMYYIQKGGSFNLKGGTIQGTGVMIVNDTQSDSVFGWNNPANGPINLTPPTPLTGGSWPTGTSSSTYAGMGMWVPRSWNQEVHFQNTFNTTISGTWYAHSAEYDVRANNPKIVFNLGNYICDLGEWNQKYGGTANTGTGTINIDPGSAAPTQRPTLVE
jgi:hypothetical protein